MRRISTITCLFFVVSVFVAVSVDAWGQILMPYRSDEGMPAADRFAKDSISNDVVLISMGTHAGPGSSPELANTIDIVNGTANLWVYTYIDRVQETGGIISMGQLPAGFRGNMHRIDKFIIQPETWPVDLSGIYAKSDKLYGRLQENAVFQSYRERNPGMVTTGLGLGTMTWLKLLGDAVDPNQPIWTVSFESASDTSMQCLIGSRTGEVICHLKVDDQLLGVQESEAARGTAAMSVSPNPASGRTRVTIDLPQGAGFGRDMSLRLYNELGEEMLDLTESFINNDHRYVEFDAEQLPAGVYYCRALGSNWQGIVGVVVEK